MDETMLGRIIARASWEPRPDYGEGVELAWDDRLADAIDWECETGLCNGEEEDADPDDKVYHGWPKWQRLERHPGGRIELAIECGHCGNETLYDAAGNEAGEG